MDYAFDVIAKKSFPKHITKAFLWILSFTFRSKIFWRLAFLIQGEVFVKDLFGFWFTYTNNQCWKYYSFSTKLASQLCKKQTVVHISVSFFLNSSSVSFICLFWYQYHIASITIALSFIFLRIFLAAQWLLHFQMKFRIDVSIPILKI